MIDNNKQLSMAVVNEIIDKAKEYTKDYIYNDDWVDTAHCSYIEGATAYATKLHEAQQENEKLKAMAERAQEVINSAEKVAKIFAHDDGNCAICELANALQQWKEGKEVGDGR